MFRPLFAAGALALSVAGFAQAEAPMAFDVAENHTRIFMADAPLHDNGMPAHGNAFISQGYIYPAGTLEADTSGVLEDGRPAFPDRVLGTWTCDGYFVGEGANAATGVWIISRQIFAFDDGDTIVTQGTEIVDTGVENRRPITGATGDYADQGGAMVQTMLGFSEHMTVNATFRIEAAAPDHASAVTDPTGFAAWQTKDAGAAPVIYDPNRIHNDSQQEWDSGAPVDPILEAPATPST